MTDHLTTPSLIPFTKYTMPNSFLDKAVEAVPRFGDRISLFRKRLLLQSMPADSSALIASSFEPADNCTL